MSHFKQHQEFFDKPIRLSEDEEKEPIKVLEEFFTDYRLSEIREINQQTNRVCLTSDIPPFQDPEERDRLLSYREREEKLIEAAAILLHIQKANDHSTSPEQFDGVSGPKTAKEIDLPTLQKEVLDTLIKVTELGKVAMKSWGVPI